jgi:hypothetical protein
VWCVVCGVWCGVWCVVCVTCCGCVISLDLIVLVHTAFVSYNTNFWRDNLRGKVEYGNIYNLRVVVNLRASFLVLRTTYHKFYGLYFY